jgi:hypothetical protein
MGNIEKNSHITLTGRTYRDDDESTLYVIPADLAKSLQIENSKVSMSPLDDFRGNRLLVVSIS